MNTKHTPGLSNMFPGYARPSVSVEPNHTKGRMVIYVLYWGYRTAANGRWRKIFFDKAAAIAYGNELLRNGLDKEHPMYWPDLHWWDLCQYDKATHTVVLGDRQQTRIREYLPAEQQ